MKILIVPDSFKGSLSSRQAASAIAEGLKNLDVDIEQVPMADGGEGTVDCLVSAFQGNMLREFVTDPIGRKIQAQFGVLKDKQTAIIEMASASGLFLIPHEKRNPLYTTTYGTGELIRKVIEKGYTKIILGLGGSATTDCGAGSLQALGVKLLDEQEQNIGFGGNYLKDLKRIDTSTLKGFENIDMTFLYDVSNKLLGSKGTTKVYSQQKGASLEEVTILENNFEHFSKIVKRDTGKNITGFAGSGAAGGLAAGLSLLFGSHLVSGSEYVIGKTKLKSKRDVVAEKVRKSDYNTYTRIRKALGGKAVVTISRGACVGCHNVVPPQRQIEVRGNKRLFTCESCGRLLVSPGIASEVEKV